MAELIWNGVGLTVPAGWEPAAIERDGLLLARADSPVCELKWKRIRGSFSHDKHIKKLTKGNRAAAVRAVDEAETPEAWTRAVETLAESGLRCRSFLWQSGETRGLGAALHNPNTGLACLVQFFVEDGADETLAAEILATFRDYGAGKSVPWALFGLAGRVPSDFVLDTFSFKPGHYRVVWWRPASGRHSGRAPVGKGPGTRLAFDRYAPASVALKGTTLADWITANLKDAPPAHLELAEAPGRVEWNGAVKTSLLRRLLRRQQFSAGRAWTADPGNAILAVTATGTVPAPDDVFESICRSFALVPEETA